MRITSHTTLLGLGSNIGDRLEQVRNTIDRLINQNTITNLQISPIYESKALLKKGAPNDWNKNFLNLCIYGLTHFSPEDLLIELKEIENKVGRKDRGIWSPREIDIDILLYDNLVLDSKNLTIPHKHFTERDFTLLPANNLIPNYKYPKKGKFYNKTISSIINMQKIDHTKCWKINTTYKQNK